MSRVLLFFLPVFFISCDCYQVVSGTVVDNVSGAPLIGATITNKNKQWSKVKTDSAGRFNISAISGGFHCPPMTVVVQQTGYKSFEQEIQSGAEEKIKMEKLAGIIINDTVFSASTQVLQSNSIPTEVFLMHNLRHLSIQGMDCDYGDLSRCWGISEIPKEIGNLKNLETLSLIVNGITKLPAEMMQLKNLKSLDLSDNLGLSNLDLVVSLPHLQQLSVFGCGLTKFPDNMGELKNLKYLGLTGNHLDRKEVERVKQQLPNCEVIFE